MRAVLAAEPGGPEVLQIREVPDPRPGPGEVLIRVAATSVNRADTLQRRGFYPPPPGASEVLGLECSGEVVELGEGVAGSGGVGDPAVGTAVCALLTGGGYADLVAVPAGQVLPIPEGVDVVTAAGLLEVAATVHSNLYQVARLQPEETVLIHGGAGGIGTFGIQYAAARGHRVLTTAVSAAKRDLCRELGAEVAIDYREEDFVEVARAATDGRGVDVILDNMGAKYLSRNVAALAPDGRLVVIGMQGGTKAEVDLGAMIAKRVAVHTTSLRSRPVDQKSAIVAGVGESVWPLIESGSIRPIVHDTLPLDRVGEAHTVMDEGGHSGKILLTMA